MRKNYLLPLIALGVLVVSLLPNAAKGDTARRVPPIDNLTPTYKETSTQTALSRLFPSKGIGEKKNRVHSAKVVQKSASRPRGTLNAVVPIFADLESYSEAFYGQINTTTGQVTRLFTGSVFSNGDDYYFESAALRGDILYIPGYSQDMVTSDYSVYLKRFNLKTGETLSNITFPSTQNSFCYSLTYDPDDDVFYGIGARLLEGELGLLVKITPNDNSTVWTSEVLKNTNGAEINLGGDEGNFLASLCYNGLDHKLYGIKDDGVLYNINPTTGSVLTQVEFDVFDEAEAIPDYGYTSPLVYSPLDRSYVTIYRDNIEESMRLVFIDADTYEVEVGSDLDAAYYIAALICTDPIAEDEAPAVPSLTEFNLVGSSLSGDFTFTAPTLKYNDVEISGKNVQMDVTIDGESICSEEMAPGASKTLTFTVAEGLHNLKITPSFPGLTGVSYEKTFYAGNDYPVAPANVSLNGNTISWSAVGAVGSNEGYVDVANVTYDVLFDGEKQNTAPITDCSYTFATPSSFASRQITVTATAHEKTSAPSNALTAYFGAANTLPLYIEPSRQEASSCQTVNANGDAEVFKFKTDDGNNWGLEMAQYSNNPDDWVILPLTAFDSNAHLYNLAFQYRNYYVNDSHYTDLEVFVGKTPNISDMTWKIYSHEGKQNSTWVSESVNFAVPEAGDYYVAFHACGSGSNYRGIRLKDFNVVSLADVPSTVPSDPTNVVFKSGDRGALEAEVSFTTPAVDMIGNALDKTKEVTVTVSCGEHMASTSLLPGEEGVLKVACDEDGYNEFKLTTSNADGSGVTRTYRQYIGLDTPAAITQITGKEGADNLQYEMSWTPSSVGANGGYVDVSKLTYNIYSISGISYTKIATTSNTSYTYTAATKQATNYLAVSAVNELGESKSNTTLTEVLGTPYDIPVIEEWYPSGTSFTYSPWRYNAVDYGDCEWYNVSNMTGLGLGDPTFVDGGFACASRRDDLKGTGELIVPKVSTKDLNGLTFSIRYWAYPGEPDMELWGRSYKNNKLVKIADIQTEKPALASAAWKDATVELPEEFSDCEWIQFRLRANFTGIKNEYAILDNLKIYQNIDNDFKVASIAGPGQLSVGETGEYLFTVTNSGLEASTGSLLVELLGDGNMVACQRVSIPRLASGRNYQSYVSFEMLESYQQYGEMAIRATAEATDDQVSINNVKTLSLRLIKSMLPVVSDLRAEWNDSHDQAVLSWSEPSLEYGDVETFELTEPFQITDRIGQWKNYDGDGLPEVRISGATWEGSDQPSSWVSIDAEALKFMDDDRLCPHSGTHYLMSRSVSYESGVDDPIQTDNWLISPEVVGGTKVSFWFGTISTEYKETIQIWVSTTDDNPESFVKYQPYTKSGSDSWENVTFTLPEDAKYFAFVYASIGQFGAMIDDVEFTPATLKTAEFDHYDVYRHDNYDWDTYHCVASGLTETSFVDTTAGDNNVHYTVVTYVNVDGRTYAGPRSNLATLWSTSVKDVVANSLSGVYGGKGEIVFNGLGGANVKVYSVDGKLVKNVNPTTDVERISAQAGIYVVRSGENSVKIVVK